MRKIIFVLYVFCSFTSQILAQVGGKEAYAFLKLFSSPRQMAMGGKVITALDQDVNMSNYNPAVINEEMHQQLGVNYSKLFGDITYGTAAFGYTYDRHLQTFAANLQYINYGNFEGRDKNGNSTQDFTGSEMALSLGYAYQIPNSDFRIGANFKLLSSQMEIYSSYATALDFGLFYQDKENDIDYGLSVRNFGIQLKSYYQTKEKLPFEVIFGVSQELENVPIKWHLTIENLQQWNVAFENPAFGKTDLEGNIIADKPSFLNNALRHTIFAVEFFPKRILNLQLSYNFRRSQELKLLEQRNFAGLSLGFGLKMNKIKFNYGYSLYSFAGNTSMFGLMLNLD